MADLVDGDAGPTSGGNRATKGGREAPMKLGLMIGYSGAAMHLPMEQILRAVLTEAWNRV